MPYALIPDGYTLKKVTELQHRAVKDHRRHEDVKTFLDNETTPLLIGGTMAIALTPVLWKLFLDKIKEEVTLTPQQDAKLSILFPVTQLIPGVGLDLSDITTLLEKLRGERPPKESTTPPVGGYGR
jgi:hypothetical protein